MYSRRQFTGLALSALAVPLNRLSAQNRPSDAATVLGVKLDAITGVYGPFTPSAGHDVVDVVARSLEAGVGHVELVNRLFEPRVTGGAVGGQAPATVTPEYEQTRAACVSGASASRWIGFGVSAASSTRRASTCSRT